MRPTRGVSPVHTPHTPPAACATRTRHHASQICAAARAAPLAHRELATAHLSRAPVRALLLALRLDAARGSAGPTVGTASHGSLLKPQALVRCFLVPLDGVTIGFNGDTFGVAAQISAGAFAMALEGHG